jgi:hypothetical protein
MKAMTTPVLAAVAATLLVAFGGDRLSAQAPVGVIAGQVTLRDAPPPRRANRYPGGGQAQAHQIQPLPAVAYLLGAVPAGDVPFSPRPAMTQQDTAFAPAVVAVRAGGTVTFPNRDPFFHNVFSYSSAQRFDLGRYPEGESKDVSFPEAGIVEVFCEVHEFMRGAILVTPNPFYAVVGADGTFRILGVPTGEHTIAFWHPDHEPVERRITVTDGGTARIEVELTR